MYSFPSSYPIWSYTLCYCLKKRAYHSHKAPPYSSSLPVDAAHQQVSITSTFLATPFPVPYIPKSTSCLSPMKPHCPFPLIPLMQLAGEPLEPQSLCLYSLIPYDLERQKRFCGEQQYSHIGTIWFGILLWWEQWAVYEAPWVQGLLSYGVGGQLLPEREENVGGYFQKIPKVVVSW